MPALFQANVLNVSGDCMDCSDPECDDPNCEGSVKARQATEKSCNEQNIWRRTKGSEVRILPGAPSIPSIPKRRGIR
jgi:hypothetical protein